MRVILRWLAGAVASVGLALATLLACGYLALVVWDRTHRPSLPGLEPGTFVPAAPRAK